MLSFQISVSFSRNRQVMASQRLCRFKSPPFFFDLQVGPKFKPFLISLNWVGVLGFLPLLPPKYRTGICTPDLKRAHFPPFFLFFFSPTVPYTGLSYVWFLPPLIRSPFPFPPPAYILWLINSLLSAPFVATFFPPSYL